MGTKTDIPWCHSTYNLWWGCTKCKQGCVHCYAERDTKRWKYNVWGPDQDRRFFAEKHYTEPDKWARKAAKAGERRRVFCGSMMDLFERHANPIVQWKQHARREQLLHITIPTTNWLDWLLLTKRPENVVEMVPISWMKDGWPLNVWLGFSASTQAEFDESCEILWDSFAGRQFPWIIFASLEPLLEPISICEGGGEILLDWIIAGGETGKHIREGHPRKLTNAMVQPVHEACAYWKIPFFFKQWGGQRPGGEALLNGQEYREFPTKTHKKSI